MLSGELREEARSELHRRDLLVEENIDGAARQRFIFDIGERAMSVLLDLMNGKAPPADPTILPTQLLVRETTAAPPSAAPD